MLKDIKNYIFSQKKLKLNWTAQGNQTWDSVNTAQLPTINTQQLDMHAPVTPMPESSDIVEHASKRLKLETDVIEINAWEFNQSNLNDSSNSRLNEKAFLSNLIKENLTNTELKAKITSYLSQNYKECSKPVIKLPEKIKNNYSITPSKEKDVKSTESFVITESLNAIIGKPASQIKELIYGDHNLLDLKVENSIPDDPLTYGRVLARTLWHTDKLIKYIIPGQVPLSGNGGRPPIRTEFREPEDLLKVGLIKEAIRIRFDISANKMKTQWIEIRRSINKIGNKQKWYNNNFKKKRQNYHK